MKTDKFERDIENHILEYESMPERDRKKVDSVLKEAREKKSVNLRLSNHDLGLLKRKAEQEGIPYQTLISSILHKYVTGQLVDEKNVVKSLQLLKFG